MKYIKINFLFLFLFLFLPNKVESYNDNCSSITDKYLNNKNFIQHFIIIISLEILLFFLYKIIIHYLSKKNEEKNFKTLEENYMKKLTIIENIIYFENFKELQKEIEEGLEKEYYNKQIKEESEDIEKKKETNEKIKIFQQLINYIITNKECTNSKNISFLDVKFDKINSQILELEKDDVTFNNQLKLYQRKLLNSETITNSINRIYFKINKKNNYNESFFIGEYFESVFTEIERNINTYKESIKNINEQIKFFSKNIFLNNENNENDEIDEIDEIDEFDEFKKNFLDKLNIISRYKKVNITARIFYNSIFPKHLKESFQTCYNKKLSLLKK